MQTEQISNDLLTIEDNFIRATAGKRLLNYIIDLFAFIILFVIIGVLLTIITPVADELVEKDRYGILISVIYAIYMSILEAVFKGKSIGKLITRTRAMNADGSTISTSAAFGRGFIRIVPFCAFSALGNPCNPWQDKWTNTMVIDEKKSSLI